MIAVALALGAAIFFSAGAVLVRKSMDQEAETYHALLASIGVPFLGSVGAALLIFPPKALVGRQVLPFVIAGLAVPVLSRTLIFQGFEKIGVARTTSINGTTPLFSAVVALLALGEGLTPQAVTGIVLTVAGIAVIAEPHRETKSWKLSGLVFPLGSALLFAIRYTLARYGLFSSPALVGSAITLATSLIVLLLAGPLIPHRPFRALSLRARGFLLGVGVAYTGAYWCMFGALAGERLAITVPLIHTDPLWSLLFVALFLRERHAITPALVWGTCLTFAGSVLIILSR
jgi:drug/metabolite transporter (DMT)-like permease